MAYPAVASMKKAHKKKRKQLIPRPNGQAGRSAEKGGYNLQEEMGLGDDDERYNRLFVGQLKHHPISLVLSYASSTIAHRQAIHPRVSVRLQNRIRPGERKSLEANCAGVFPVSVTRHADLLNQVQNDITFFKKYEGGWPIRDIIRTYLSNEQTRRGVDIDAELKERLNDTDNSDTEHASPPATTRKQKTKVHFTPTANEAVDADDEDEDETNEDKPEPTKIAARRKVRLFSSGIWTHRSLTGFIRVPSDS